MEKNQKNYAAGSRLLAFDVGNTNITVGIFLGKTIEHQWRLQCNTNKTSDEYGIEMEQILSHWGYDSSCIQDIIMGSVVPVMNHRISSMSRRFLHKEPYIVGEGTKTGMPIRMESPKDVGADRIINGVAGFEQYGGPLIIVDIGTAITHDVISSSGAYLGGTIAPGIQIASEGLTTKTAKLPKVELSLLDHAIGRNTIEAMQVGIVQGYIGLVDHLTEILLAEIHEKEGAEQEVKVIATGGFSSLLSSNSRYTQIIDRDLTLQGLRIIYERTMKARIHDR